MLRKINQKIKRKNIPFKTKKMIFERDSFRCVCCGASNLDKQLEVDHFIPFSRGGTDDIDNLITLCIDCNRSKSNDIIRFNTKNPFEKILEDESLKNKRFFMNHLRQTPKTNLLQGQINKLVDSLCKFEEKRLCEKYKAKDIDEVLQIQNKLLQEQAQA